MAYLKEHIACQSNPINHPKNKRNIITRTDSEEKTDAQILAAKRSLITNLVLIGQSLVTGMAMLLMTTEYLPFFTVFTFTILKGALPILTTIANFGTVANVISQYWAYLKHKIC
jgi:hypothetical protein